MALTKEQFAALYSKGLSVEQITAFESGQTPETMKASQSKPQEPGFLEKASNVVSKYFPGKQLGTALGNSFDALKGLATGDMERFNSSAQANGFDMARKVAGDVTNIGLTVAAPTLGGGSSVLGRIGANTALGAGLSASKAVSEGESGSNILKDAAIGGVTGGAISGASEFVSGLTNHMPDRIVKRILPKLKDGNVDYAINNTKLGSVSSLTKDSEINVQTMGKQIESVLKSPKYITHTGDGNTAIQKTLEAFPDSEYTPDIILRKVKSLVGEKAGLVQKVANGSATLYEKNVLRMAIDKATNTVYTSLNRPPEIKLIGSTFADALRSEVQATAKETAPIFEKLTKEINLRNALQAANKRLQKNLPVSLYDLAAGAAVGGGPAGIATAGIAKVARMPGVNLAAAKGLQAAAPVANVAGKVAQGAIAPAINSEQDYLNSIGY